MKALLLILPILAVLLPAVEAQSSINAGRAIEIRIQGVPSEEMQRVNNMYPVSEGGFIRMPFIGNVRAAGLQPTTLAERIEGRYRSAQIYTNPTIQVIANSDSTTEEFMVTIGGQVKQPGPVRYSRGMTLYQAVQSAGGATKFGSMGRVKLIREGNQKQYDLEQDKAKSVVVKPNDTVVVPQKNWIGQ